MDFGLSYADPFLQQQLAELLDEVAALMVWTLQYAKKNNILLDEAFKFHASRIQSILYEIGTPYDKNPILANEERDESEQNPPHPGPRNWRDACVHK